MTHHILFDFFGTLVEYSASRTQQGYERSHLLLTQAGSDLGYEGFLTRWSAHCDEFERRKPNPAIFTHTLEILGVGAENCVYVGDNFEADYLGARSAGIRAMPIDPSREHPVPEGERLDSIFELPKLLPTVA